MHATGPLFTRKRKLGHIVEPVFLNKTINISNNVKYLGVILDIKLNWRDRIQEGANKAHRCWATRKRAIGSKWGFNPKMTHWLFKSVIRPVLTYASLVWWTAMDKNVISKYQRNPTSVLLKHLRRNDDNTN